MKKILVLLVNCIVTANSFAQAPQSMSYQAVIRKSNNTLVVSTPVGIKISILQGSSSGIVVYTETHHTTTDATGLVALQIGKGTIVSGSFNSINWAFGPFYIKTETDPAGGTNYSITGTTQLMSVPYAMNAANGNNPGTAPGAMKYWDGTEWTSIQPGEQGQTLNFCNGVPAWGPCSYINLRPNVYVVDTAKLRLVYDTALINNYKFQFNIISGTPDYKANDYIIVVEHGGYIVKINAVTNTTGKVLYTTEQASMSDVFVNSSFRFNISSENLTQARVNSTSANGFTFDLNDITLINTGPLFLKLNSGSISFNPNWNFDFDFNTDGIESFELSCKDANLDAEFNLTVKSTAGVPLYNKTDTIGRMQPKYFVRFIGLVPVMVQMDVLFLANNKISLSAVTNKIVNYTSHDTVTMGLYYDQAGWNSNYAFKTSNHVSRIVDEGKLTMDLDFYIYPKVSFKLYNIVGPYMTAGLGSNLNCNINTASNDWDVNIYAFLQAQVGVNAAIFKKQLFDYSKSWRSDSLEYHTPYNLNRVSGDNQLGEPNLFLPDPVKVRVVDNLGNPEFDVPVYFTVTNGGGSVLNPVVHTNQDGYAQTLWKLGTVNTIHRLEAVSKKADGSFINHAPVDFAATFKSLAVVTTDSINSITEYSALAFANVITDGGNTVTVRGVCWDTLPLPTVDKQKSVNGSGAGNFISNLSGLKDSTRYYLRAYATNSQGTVYGSEISFVTKSGIRIGTQIWMSSNLSVSNYSNGDAIPEVADSSIWPGLTTGAWCNYLNDPLYGSVLGKIYNGYAVNDPRGLAPKGWHVATAAEWVILTQTLGGADSAGGRIKKTGYIPYAHPLGYFGPPRDSIAYWLEPNTGATNSSGFTALPGGHRYPNEQISYYGVSLQVFWWTSTPTNGGNYPNFNEVIGLGYNSAYLDYPKGFPNNNGFYVRCVKDQ